MVRLLRQNPFIVTREMTNVLAISKEFSQKPSQVLGLSTPLGCYCFDAASVLYLRYLEDKKTPRFAGDEKSNPGLQALLG